MKIFLDTEFTGLKQNANLLSLALIAENEQKLYAEFNDSPLDASNPWLEKNVFPHLLFRDCHTLVKREGELIQYKDNRVQITQYITSWLGQFNSIEMWADVPHYDWVFFCELFGGTLHLPDNMSYMCMDLATMFRVKGYAAEYNRLKFLNENGISMPGQQHNALYDAEVLKQCYEILIDK